MCGINGFNFKDPDLIQKMNQKIKYRGPDDDGYFCDKDVSLGHVRLSILDLTSAGHQPMFSQDKKLAIVFNGEIYNFQELKEKYASDYKFQSRTDTEVLLVLYQKLGRKMLDELNGIFAFAIYDIKNKKIFLARDQMGVKPLFYYFDGHKFIFSSEMVGILTHGLDFKMETENLDLFFNLFYLPGENTLIEKIKKLPSAHFLEFDLMSQKIIVEKYWDVNNFNDLKDSVQSIKNTLKEKVGEAVKRQMISDRPVGLFLSGGIDSNIVLSQMVKYSSHQVKTYTVGFDTKEEEQERYNADAMLARKSSHFFDTEHHELIISGRSVRENFEEVVSHIGSPSYNGTNFLTYFLSQLAKKDIAVALGGDGGDELFGGYPHYYTSHLISIYQKLPAFLRKGFLNRFGQIIRGEKFKKFSLSGTDRYLALRVKTPEDARLILKKSFHTPDRLKNYFEDNYFSSLTGSDFEKKMMYVDLSTWLVDESLRRDDKMSMAFGLEKRVPLLDRELVDFAFQIPSKLKINMAQTKIILKETFKKDLPDFIFNQPKRGWMSPASKWLRSDLKELAYEVLSPGYNKETETFFDFKEIRRVLDGHIERRKYNLNLIMSLMTFQVWYRQVFNQKK